LRQVLIFLHNPRTYINVHGYLDSGKDKTSSRCYKQYQQHSKSTDTEGI
jgi:hypothetical protein